MSVMRSQLSGREAAPNERFGRKVTVMHGGTVALIAILALAAFITLDRAIEVQRESALALSHADRERLSAQQVASLTARYALGDRSVQRDLVRAIDAYAITNKQRLGDTSNMAAYVARARGVVATAPRNPSIAARTAVRIVAEQSTILAAIDAAERNRLAAAGRFLTSLRLIGAAICTMALATLFVGGLAVFRPMAQRIVALVRDADESARLATVDPLTGMLNQRSFQARGAIEIQKARRYGRPLSLLMIDADQLAAIEGRYGTDGGETLLRALTTSFFAGTRISDLVGRINTEQFAILLPETNCDGAKLLAERLRHKISDLCVPIADNVVSCTVSIGVAAAERDAAFLGPTFRRADEALYEAKQRGRNRVVVAAAA